MDEYDDVKIKEINIEHFRGIPNNVSLNFELQGRTESALIFGDNGSGKSSIVDAIEFVTQGSVQGKTSQKSNDWLYHSISFTWREQAKVELVLDNDNRYRSSMKRNYDEQKIDKEGTIIKAFRYAPYILRRQDILSFWELPSYQKLKIFLKYAITKTENMLMSPNENLRLIEQKRIDVKQKKRELIEEICKYYRLDYNDMVNKGKRDFFTYVKLFNQGKNLKQLNPKHPQYKNLVELNGLFDEIVQLNKKIKSAKSIDDNEDKNGTARKKLQEIMLNISPLVTKAFKDISRTNDYVKEITISVASQTEMSMDFIAELDNGAKASPVMLFSEANRDLLALLIYFEFILYSRKLGQAKVLVLDDIFQSVDSTIRFRVMQYLIGRFSDWQLILITHDRLWKEQLTQLFRNHSKPLQQLEILQWSFESGPQIVGSINNFDEKLKKAMEIGSTADICASAGYLLEYMCEKLSCILSTSIKRKYGDRYTIGDLWPGIYKELKKSLAKNEFSELNDLLYLRNMVGSHYNEWSLSLSRSEAIDFANAVLKAYYHVYCEKCGKWIKGKDDIQAEEFQYCCNH